jgi:hypothetical protein
MNIAHKNTMFSMGYMPILAEGENLDLNRLLILKSIQA